MLSALAGQTVKYRGRVYRDKLITNIEQDTENRGIDSGIGRRYGDQPTYGRVTLPVDQGKFIVVQRGDCWLTVDTI